MRLADVAVAAGVDVSAVSRILNNDPVLSVRPETRERVLAIARDLGYRPNAAARSLRTARAGTLGLFLPDFNNPVYAQVITGAEAAASERGSVLVTASSNVVGRDASTYVDLLGSGRVDGLLLAGDALGASTQQTLDSLGLPYLWVNRRVSGARRWVILDDGGAARMAVEHLAGLGHTRIAHLAGPASADTSRRRREGYTAAMEAAGLAHEPELICSADYTPQGGAVALLTLMAAADPPTGIVVANVASAIGALSSARRHGVRVPRDLSIVAIHDSTLADFLDPPLTTIRMPLVELGRRAVEILLTAEPDAVVDEVLAGDIELVVRDSTAPPHTQRARRGSR